MRSLLVLVAASLALSGCVHDARDLQPISANANQPFAANVTWNGTGDLFLRLEVLVEQPTSCELDFRFSGIPEDPEGDVLLFLTQDGDGDPIRWSHWDMGYTQVNPSVEGSINGQTVSTSSRRAYEHWAVGETDEFQIPSQGLVFSFAAKNLHPWPSRVTEADYDRDDSRIMGPGTARVTLECADSPTVNVLHGLNLRFINDRMFAHLGSAYVFLTDENAAAAIVAGGEVKVQNDAAAVEALCVGGGDPTKMGRLVIDHPAGTDEWLLTPTDLGTLAQVRDGPGDYTIRLDWASAGLPRVSCVVTDVAPLVTPR